MKAFEICARNDSPLVCIKNVNISTMCLGSCGPQGSVVHMMENELECMGDREGRDRHLAEHFLKKIFFLLARVIAFAASRFAWRY